MESNNYKKYDLYKENPTDKVQWVDVVDREGEFVFTFDGETFFNLYKDYPHKLTAEQKKIFDKENPFWADYFKDRS